MPPDRLVTERLILRRFNRRDVGPLADAVHDSLAALNEWLPWAHPGYRREDAANYVRDSLEAWKEAGPTTMPFGARTTSADTLGISRSGRSHG